MSINENEDENVTEPPKKPAKRVHCEWNHIISYTSRSEVEKYIAAHDCFYEHSSNTTAKGKTVYYYCSKVTARSARLCPVKLKVFESSVSTSFGVSVTTFVHDHTATKLSKKSNYSDAMKQEAFSLKMDFAMKPKLIQKHLKQNYPTEQTPNVAQVRRILQNQIATVIPPTITYGQLYEWCKSEMAVPEDIDEPFVLDYFNSKAPQESFAFIVSTIRLLQNTVNRQNVCSDGTYKVTWQGFPLIGVGFLDRTQRFHIIALCLTAHESAIEYSFVFKSVQNAVQKHTAGIYTPSVLLSDAATAIRNAFYASFETAKQNVICYIHVQRNIARRSYHSKSNKDGIMNDFLIIQGSASEKEFDMACELYIKKWTSSEPEFCSYFRSEWMQPGTKNWYNGYTPFMPAHNNANEGYNLHMKRDHLRERLPLNTFKVAFRAMVREMSERYDVSNDTGEVKKIRDLPDITNQMFEAAHSWYTDPKTLIGEVENDDLTSRTFVVASSKYLSQAKKPSLNDLNAIQNKNFEDFDDYVQNGFAMQYEVQMKNDATTCFLDSTCMCKCFHRNFICKHIIGLAFHMKLKKVPKNADSNLIGKKRPRGRIAATKKALIKQ